MHFFRYAIYHLPDGALGRWGAEWLGWDARRGRALPHPDIAGLDPATLTATPRRYGFHATMKAPFHLAEGVGPDDLADALQVLAGRHAPFDMALHLSQDWGFLALRPAATPPTALAALESALVRGLDRFRAPLTARDIARRRPEALPPQARAHLGDWGYPFVLDLFHYHLTLTGALPAADLTRISAALAPQLPGLLARPMPVAAMALAGEDQDGFFHRIAEFPLTASSAI
ncbi:DUF1045 domain-containing protein [Paracoccus sp. DMF-8]|uniref:DUF1045 domain-containing protein n=1 Tax=Paracoccus sp. DMF-8 TaxID=3019445 RepID=UPI0023E398AA|nr:DUF1045 domain-containing protein [Paracoccus sp. DMF-8]MDF3607409.1 DUF1045 domain-containing protein [Paracoccus sp. DMF-8]